MAEAVAGAYEVGYRHFDCAAVYGNEAEIGHVLARLPREQILGDLQAVERPSRVADVVPACQK